MTALSSSAQEAPLLSVSDLTVTFQRGGRAFKAVEGVSLDVASGETLGLVGESGSGKTTIGRALLRLLPRGGSKVGGSINYDGQNLLALPDRAMRGLRGELQIIFQDPVSSFNPRRQVQDIVGEGLHIRGVDSTERRRLIEAALADVGFKLASVEGRRPHQFSGGQCQRIAIARALAVGPRLVVCDEPVASLDVSVQAQVINLLQDIREKRRLALIFISHDLAVVRNVSDRVAVLYMGKIVEIGAGAAIYGQPAHPYTRMLLEAVPVPDPARRLTPIGGAASEMPSRLDPPSGCRFRTRCSRAQALCAEVEPKLAPMPHGQEAACHFPYDEPAPDVAAAAAGTP